VRFARSFGEADATLTIDGIDVGSMHVAQVMHIMSSVGPSVGFDNGSAVSDRYDAPNAFTGTLRVLHVDADPEGRHREPGSLALAELAAEMARQ